MGYEPPYEIGNYTGIVRDLMDDVVPPGNYDHVSGYTITQIEQSVIDASTATDWKENLKDLCGNAPEDELDDLFDYWSQ